MRRIVCVTTLTKMLMANDFFKEIFRLHIMDLGEHWVVGRLIPRQYSGFKWESVLNDLVVMADQAWDRVCHLFRYSC